MEMGGWVDAYMYALTVDKPGAHSCGICKVTAIHGGQGAPAQSVVYRVGTLHQASDTPTPEPSPMLSLCETMSQCQCQCRLLHVEEVVPQALAPGAPLIAPLPAPRTAKQPTTPTGTTAACCAA